VRFTGAVTAVYRLHLSTGPVVTALFPAVVSTQAKVDVQLRGYGLDPKKLSHSLPPISAQSDIAAVPVPNALHPIQLVTVDQPALVEKEPNNEPAQATPIKPGDTIGGHITDKDPLDRFAITVKKGDRLSLRIFARRLGSPLDPVLQVFNAEGKSLLDQDDSGENNNDPQAEWTAPADGAYQLVVKDRFNHGGETFAYVLRVLPSVPGYTVAVADAKPITLEPGKTANLKASIKLAGNYKEPLICRLASLPPGVHAAEVPVPAKGGDVELKLEAAADAPESQGAIQVTVWTKDNRIRIATYPLRGENLRGTSLLDHAQPLWLTVKGK
ncbi:MAG TPA: PPC domain-containing protein, partial [Prosthecobacter sp.]|nr:PPC domain-containing protein [Prosthecobacter sp.]